MDAFLYTAVSGATRNLQQQQISANNLANVNTQGFRADLENARSAQIQGEGYKSRVLSQARNAGIDMQPGATYHTGRALDVAIQGSGLIALQGQGREVYTRNGSIDVDSQGNLTINGLKVLGEGGPIILPPYSSVAIGNDGTISIVFDDGNTMANMNIDQIKLVDIPANRLRKNADGFLMANTLTSPQNETIQLKSEHLEASNVSAIHEMVNSISLNRQFEAQVKMMKAAEDLAQAGNRLIRD